MDTLTGPLDPTPVRVLICDDHALFRRGLVLVLEEEPGIEVVAEAADGEQAIEAARAHLPDVVLMDLRMPRVDGLAATRAIVEQAPGTAVVILTGSDDEDDLVEAMKAGAVGYLLKEISIDDVGAAVRAAHAGQRLVTPSLATRLISEFAAMSPREGAAGSPSEGAPPVEAPRLTARELQVLRQVAAGGTNRDIADRLGIAENTVKNHMRNILEKLRLHSRTEAVMYAVRSNLLSP